MYQLIVLEPNIVITLPQRFFTYLPDYRAFQCLWEMFKSFGNLGGEIFRPSECVKTASLRNDLRVFFQRIFQFFSG